MDHGGATSEERHVSLDSEDDDDYGLDGDIEFEDAQEDEGGGGAELENTFHYIWNGVLRAYVSASDYPQLDFPSSRTEPWKFGRWTKGDSSRSWVCSPSFRWCIF
jgi:hypothetical protein